MVQPQQQMVQPQQQMVQPQQQMVQPQQQMVQPQQQMVQPQHQSIQQEHYPNPANVVKRSETPLTTKALFSGGYKPTKRNMKALRKYKKGKSIGYTMRSSLKAKGLIARANGSYKVSKKYRG
jgi:hypothetical protein